MPIFSVKIFSGPCFRSIKEAYRKTTALLNRMLLGKFIPEQAQIDAKSCRRLGHPWFLDSQHMKVKRSSALGTGHLYPQGKIPGTHFPYRLIRHQGHSAAGRIRSMKNLKDPIKVKRLLAQCFNQLDASRSVAVLADTLCAVIESFICSKCWIHCR